MSGSRSASDTETPAVPVPSSPQLLQSADAENSTSYVVTVNGSRLPVHRARVSAIPVNQVWPGYQRPLAQTELAEFVSFDLEGPSLIEVISARPIESVQIRPQSLGIVPAISGNRLAFTLPKPGQVVVEVNGWHGALHIFAYPPEQESPDPQAPGVLAFGPGEHHAGKILLHDDETLYLAKGAVLHAAVEAAGASNVRICGRGILDNSTFARGAGAPIAMQNCTGLTIEGITIRDSSVWTVTLTRCTDVVISNIKLIGMWRYNSDGIDLVNCERVVIEDSFVRAFDDNIVLKGFDVWHGKASAGPLRDVVVRRCVLWNDWGRALEIGAETRTDAINDVLFQNCDIVHFVHRAMDIQNGDRAHVHHICFEDIRVEEAIVDGAYREDYGAPDTDVGMLIELLTVENPYSKDVERGKISDIVFRNITASGERFPYSRFTGHDAAHGVEGILIETLVIQNKPVTTLEEGQISVNAYVKDVTLRA